MTTKLELETALKEAMRRGDEQHKRTLRMVIAAIKLAEVEKGKTADEPAIAAILQKEIKSRRESIADAERAQRSELVTENLADITILESYLPKALSQAEIEELGRAAIAEVGAKTVKEMGQVMKVLMPRVQGRAEGAVVNQVVRRLLE
jgi:uncharacterized protein YqeY